MAGEAYLNILLVPPAITGLYNATKPENGPAKYVTLRRILLAQYLTPRRAGLHCAALDLSRTLLAYSELTLVYLVHIRVKIKNHRQI